MILVIDIESPWHMRDRDCFLSRLIESFERQLKEEARIEKSREILEQRIFKLFAFSVSNDTSLKTTCFRCHQQQTADNRPIFSKIDRIGEEVSKLGRLTHLHLLSAAGKPRLRILIRFLRERSKELIEELRPG